MRVRIEWMPGQPGIVDVSNRDEDGLRVLFGETETNRILSALAAANYEPVTLTVNGRDAGFLDRDSVQAEFSVRERSGLR
jgi:hypothetical protein